MLGEQELQHFIETGYPRVVAAVTFATGDLHAAEDAVQEALVRAWVASEKGQEMESLPAWVTTVALNISRKAWRRVLLERRIAPRIAASSEVDEKGLEAAMDIRAAMARLPRRQREVAVLRYVLEMSTQEVASALGIDEGTVKSHLARARGALGRGLSSEEVSDVTT